MLIEAEIHAAAAVAAKIHRKDTRKYSGLPYLHHCVATAAWVRSLLRRTHYNIVSQHTDPRQAATDMVCAALLHDTAEHMNMDAEDLDAIQENLQCNRHVATLVAECTPKHWPAGTSRAIKFDTELRSWAFNSRNGLSYFVKLADIQSNVSDTLQLLKSTEHLGMLPQDAPNLDLAYLERYMQEKILVLNAISTNPTFNKYWALAQPYLTVSPVDGIIEAAREALYYQQGLNNADFNQKRCVWRIHWSG